MVFLRSLSRSLPRASPGLLRSRPGAGKLPTYNAINTPAIRTLTSTAPSQGKVLLVLYDVSYQLSFLYGLWELFADRM